MPRTTTTIVRASVHSGDDKIAPTIEEVDELPSPGRDSNGRAEITALGQGGPAASTEVVLLATKVVLPDDTQHRTSPDMPSITEVADRRNAVVDKDNSSHVPDQLVACDGVAARRTDKGFLAALKSLRADLGLEPAQLATFM
jgi:hypothetical protein